jgi:hypothetical protein
MSEPDNREFTTLVGCGFSTAKVEQRAESETRETEDTDALAVAQPISRLETVWDAISDAGSAVADKALGIGAASVEITTDAAKHIAQVSVNGVSSAIEYLDDAIDEQAIKAAIVNAADAVGDKVEQVTGKQLVKMLEAKLRRQDEYNDILATRLAEALDRIAVLEQRGGK